MLETKNDYLAFEDASTRCMGVDWNASEAEILGEAIADVEERQAAG